MVVLARMSRIGAKMKEMELLLVLVELVVEEATVEMGVMGLVVSTTNRENEDFRAWSMAKRAEVRRVVEVVVWRRMLDCAIVRSEDFCVVRRRERARPSGISVVAIHLSSSLA